ncbi:hypothetical protein ACJMK2_014610 [Sinanodonta woodiana]|uniref:FZ domain-containing protein n=1 Tax=Sinanodonta woodiana TaxID=1069815 RepID=A0ABD3V197_SINWO
MRYMRLELAVVVFLCIVSLVMSETFYDGQYDYPKRCVPNRSPICQSMPYNETLFPNLIGNENIDEANAILTQFSPLITYGCSDQLDDFLCLVYIPPCTSTIYYAIPPCRRLCDLVASACVPLMKEFGFPWPDNLNCKRFPETSTSDKLCIQSSKSDNSDETSYSPDIGPVVSEPVTKFIRRTTPRTRSDTFEGNTPLEVPKGYPINILFLVTSGHKVQILDVTSYKEIDTINAFSGVAARMSAAVDYHYSKNYIFWASNLEGYIYRGRLELDKLREIRELIRITPGNVEDLVVDWILDVLYWTELYPPQIRTATVDGKRVTTVVSENMVNPKAIAVDPLEGKIFWIDAKGALSSPWNTLESYSIFTGERQLLVNITDTLISGCGRPRALAADLADKRVYWVDARSESMHSVTYDGKDHRLLRKGEYLAEPESIAIYRDNVIWTDSVTSSILQVSKRDGSNFMVIKEFVSNPPSNLRIFTPEMQPKTGLRYNLKQMIEKWDEVTKNSSEEDLDNGDVYDYDYPSKDTKSKGNGGSLIFPCAHLILFGLVFSSLYR